LRDPTAMRSIDSIVDEWKAKLDAIPTDAPGKRQKGPVEASETEEESQSEGEEIEKAIREADRDQLRDERRAQNAKVRAVYDSISSQEDAKNRAADELIAMTRSVYGLASPTATQFEYIVRHIAMSASEHIGQWAIALEMLSGDQITPVARLPFFERPQTPERERFYQYVPFAKKAADFLLMIGAFRKRPETPIAAQDPDASWIRGIDNEEENAGNNDPVEMEEIAAPDEDDLFVDMRTYSPMLSPDLTLTHRDLIRSVCGLLDNDTVNHSPALSAGIEDEMSDGRHSIHAHSPDFSVEPGEGGALQLPPRVAVYYRHSTEWAGVSPAIATGSLMAGFRTLIVVALKMHLEANGDDSPVAALSELRRDPSLDIRHAQLIELCIQLHDIMERDDIATALETEDGISRHASYRTLHTLLHHHNAPSTTNNGLVHKLKKLQGLPANLADALSTDTYNRESPLVSLLIHTCVFVSECILSRMLSKRDVPFHRGMQSISLPAFPSFRVNEAIDTLEAEARAASGSGDASSDSSDSPMYSIPSPANSVDSQQTIVDSP
jgi:hypothetical protein